MFTKTGTTGMFRPPQNPLERRRKRVPQDGILRIRHVEVATDKPFQNGLREFLVNGWRPSPAGEPGLRTVARDNGKRGDRLEEKCLHVIAAKDDHRIRFGFFQPLSQRAHRCEARVELSGVLFRWTRKKLRRVYRRHC